MYLAQVVGVEQLYLQAASRIHGVLYEETVMGHSLLEGWTRSLERTLLWTNMRTNAS